jgi:hypothetical protein
VIEIATETNTVAMAAVLSIDVRAGFPLMAVVYGPIVPMDRPRWFHRAKGAGGVCLLIPASHRLSVRWAACLLWAALVVMYQPALMRANPGRLVIWKLSAVEISIELRKNQMHLTNVMMLESKITTVSTAEMTLAMRAKPSVIARLTAKHRCHLPVQSEGRNLIAWMLSSDVVTIYSRFCSAVGLRCAQRVSVVMGCVEMTKHVAARSIASCSQVEWVA